MKRYGLVGHPLGHSFSKVFFTEKFERESIDACYKNFDLDNLAALHELLQQQPDLIGFNVTIPYKKAILPYLDEVDSIAAEVGAVNTVKVMADGKLKGYNTDVVGIEATLADLANPKGSPTEREVITSGALILGTGGASKAVQYVLRKYGLPYHLVSRSLERGSWTYDGLTPEIIQEHRLIINATPVGMTPHIDAAPRIPYEVLTPQHVLFDLIYNPEETLFLKHGREHGATAFNGLKMLYAQAEASWAIWNQL